MQVNQVDCKMNTKKNFSWKSKKTFSDIFGQHTQWYKADSDSEASAQSWAQCLFVVRGRQKRGL